MDRRHAIKTVATAGVAATLPRFSGAEVGKKSQLKVALVGCSGRGIGAVSDMLNAANGAVKIVAIADLFADRNEIALKAFERYAKKFGKDVIDVPPSRQFVGWDAYKQVLGEERKNIFSTLLYRLVKIHVCSCAPYLDNDKARFCSQNTRL